MEGFLDQPLFGGRRTRAANRGRAIVILVCQLLAAGMAAAQSAEPLPEPAAKPATAAPGLSAASVLGGFHSIRLGMTVEQVKTELVKESLFLFRGDRDVSLVPQTQEILIEVPGRTFVERGYFQFHDGKLLVMILVLAREEVSYFEVYRELSSRYGEATSLDPSSAVWELGGMRLSLEKPVVLKYLDRATFEALRDSSRAGRDYELLTRQQFLGTL
jgi:hypothetical protein